MIAVIAGSAGTGKTFSALDWAAQKPGILFIAGDEELRALVEPKYTLPEPEEVGV